MRCGDNRIHPHPHHFFRANKVQSAWPSMRRGIVVPLSLCPWLNSASPRTNTTGGWLVGDIPTERTDQRNSAKVNQAKRHNQGENHCDQAKSPRICFPSVQLSETTPNRPEPDRSKKRPPLKGKMKKDFDPIPNVLSFVFHTATG